MPFDTTGWFLFRFLDQRLSLRIPPAFVRDETVAFVEGGWRWRDGSRTFDIASDPNPGILSAPPIQGASLCRDTLDGVPIVIQTNHWLAPLEMPGGRGPRYSVTACSTVRDNIGYYEVIRGVSPDSADQHLFLGMIRTLHQTGYPSGERRRWFGRQPLKVRVHPFPVKGGVRYEYRIFNGSKAPISKFAVGYDQDLRLTYIRHLPRWEAAVAACGSPRGWTVKFVMAGEDRGFFEWSATDPNRAIAPGRALPGFSILSDRPDGAYHRGRWTAYTSSDKDERWFSGEAIPDPVR